MKKQPFDTHPRAERFHIELIRKAPISHRLQIVNSLIKTTRQLSWQAICEHHAGETSEKRMQLFISILYGDKLSSQRITDLLKKRGRQIK